MKRRDGMKATAPGDEIARAEECCIDNYRRFQSALMMQKHTEEEYEKNFFGWNGRGIR